MQILRLCSSCARQQERSSLRKSNPNIPASTAKRDHLLEVEIEHMSEGLWDDLFRRWNAEHLLTRLASRDPGAISTSPKIWKYAWIRPRHFWCVKTEWLQRNRIQSVLIRALDLKGIWVCGARPRSHISLTFTVAWNAYTVKHQAVLNYNRPHDWYT